MKLILRMIFLTLVSLTNKSFGAPDKSYPPINEQNLNEFSETDEIKEDTHHKIESLNLTVPEKKIENVNEEIKLGEFYPYTTSISPRFGIHYPIGVAWSYLYGIQYMMHSQTAIHKEIGADLLPDGTGIISYSFRKIVDQNNTFRPFFKIGIGIHIIPQENIGNFLQIKNYQFKLGGGIEKLIIHPISIRTDIEAYVSVSGIVGIITLGYSWAW